MKAIFLDRFGDPEDAFSIRETDLPECRSNQVRIKVEAFGLNFADVLARKGLYPETPPRPCIIGYEVTGTVEAKGDEVPEGLIGKRVVGMTRFGGYAEYATTDYRAVAELPSGMAASEALALGTQGTTAYACLHGSMNLRKGDRVLVHAAAGGVGIMLCQMALAIGCEVFGTASRKEKLDFLDELGVQHPLNYRESDYALLVRKKLNGNRLDATFNALAGKSIKKDLKLLGAGGKLVLYGAASRVGKGSGLFSGLKLLFDTGLYTPLAFLMRSKSLIGINILKLGDYKPEWVAECMRQTVGMAQSGILKPVVHESFSAEDIGAAHRALEGRGTMGKLAVHW